MNTLHPILTALILRAIQLGGICVLTVFSPIASMALTPLPAGTSPLLFELDSPPAALPKRKAPPSKRPEQLKLKFDRSFLRGLA